MREVSVFGVGVVNGRGLECCRAWRGAKRKSARAAKGRGLRETTIFHFDNKNVAGFSAVTTTRHRAKISARAVDINSQLLRTILSLVTIA